MCTELSNVSIQDVPPTPPPIGSIVKSSFSKHLLLENIKGQFWPTASVLILPSVKNLGFAFLNDPLKILQDLILSSTPINLLLASGGNILQLSSEEQDIS